MLQAHADEDDASTQTKDTQKLVATWSGKMSTSLSAHASLLGLQNDRS